VLYSQSSNVAAINAFALDPASAAPHWCAIAAARRCSICCDRNLNSDIVSVSTATGRHCRTKWNRNGPNRLAGQPATRRFKSISRLGSLHPPSGSG